MSQSLRFFAPPFSMAAVHFLQKRISFSQCPAEKSGTNKASGEKTAVQGVRVIMDLTMLKTSAVRIE